MMMMDLERVRKFYPQHRWPFSFDIVEVHNTYFDEGVNAYAIDAYSVYEQEEGTVVALVSEVGEVYNLYPDAPTPPIVTKAIVDLLKQLKII